jgi:hypothetical protein
MIRINESGISILIRLSKKETVLLISLNKITKMRNHISAIFLICLFVSCSNKIYDSAGWQNQKITVDGKINEWPNPLRFYDQETGISYNISNDRNNIYFAASISNEYLQTKILLSGLEFRIDTLGKKSFGVSLKYPIGNMSETDHKPNNPPTKEALDKRPDRSSFKLSKLEEATEIQLVGFKTKLGKIIPLASNSSGISAAINLDPNGKMNYEAVIPLSTFYKAELHPADSSKVFNFQIKVNTMANSGNPSGNNGGTRGGGMRGGMRGGGMRGGMRGGGMGGGMRSGGMGGDGMRGEGMNVGRNSEYRGNGTQGNTDLTGVTKITIKLQLAYK